MSEITSNRASREWNSRRNDERFWTPEDMFEAIKRYRAQARTATVPMSSLRVEAMDGDVRIVGKEGAPASLTNWAFGQLSTRAKAPAGYLRELPATLAAQNLNHGLKEHGKDGEKAALLVQAGDGGFCARAVLSEEYTRIWNADVMKRVMQLHADGWRNPPGYQPWNAELGEMPTRKATAEDAKISLTVKEGDIIAPAGLYASAEDMFVFLVHPDRVIKEEGNPVGLMRGTLIWNSEVGKSRFGVQSFLFRGPCGNHILWGVEELKQVSIVHRGSKAEENAFNGFEVAMTEWANQSAAKTEAKIDTLKKSILKGRTKDEVLEFIVGKKLLTKSEAAASYDAVVEDVDGPAYTIWGFAQGVTRYSQQQRNADARTALDRAAGKVLEIAF